jgi:tRNA(fMet)-specific endonuclease VapC
MVCLDTNAVITAINKRKPNVRRRLKAARGRHVCGRSDHRLIRNALWNRQEREGARKYTAILTAFLALNVTPWPFEPEDAREAGEIRAELE